MGIISRLLYRLSARVVGRGVADPEVLIAERFVTSIAQLSALDLPNDIHLTRPDEALVVIIVDEAGRYPRQARLGPSGDDIQTSRVVFESIPAVPGTWLWLFVVVATPSGGSVAPQQVRSLIEHGRSLGDRPPIELACIDISAPPSPEGADEVAISAAPRITFAMLSDVPDPALLPPIDQPEVDTAKLTPEQQAWWRDGVIVLPGFLPDSVIDPYIARREQLGIPGGWSSPTPYLQVEELRRVALYPPLRTVLRSVVGEEMMLHLALTGWVSTERNWHQDDYLNPPTVNSWYAAVWIALDHIHPDSGPFEYVPGSHRWPLLRGDKVRLFMTDEELASTVGPLAVNNWPKITERYVVPAIEAEIRDRAAAPVRFLGEKGDVLIWHGRLLHRGTKPRRPDLNRRSLIAHYSGVSHRPDMPDRRVDAEGGTYAVFDIPLF